MTAIAISLLQVFAAIGFGVYVLKALGIVDSLENGEVVVLSFAIGLGVI
ncbi:MAG: hypothetical protein HQ513_06155, partial [Rhodospirillales bacterium]|nr:hypothetical protein [Rhodospirillales bacterium]